MDTDWRREDLRATNIARADAGLPSSVLGLPADTAGRAQAQEWPYPIQHERLSLDDTLLGDLLRRVQKLEHTISAQQEVIRGLVRERYERPPSAEGQESKPGAPLNFIT